VAHQLLEDLATGGEGLRGCLGGLEIGSLCGNGTSRGGNLGRLVCVQRGRTLRSIVDTWWPLGPTSTAPIISPRSSARTAGGRPCETGRSRTEAGYGLAVLTWTIVAWRTILLGPVIARAIIAAGAAVVPPGTAIVAGTIIAGTVIAARAAVVAAGAAIVARAVIRTGRRRKRRRGSGVPLRRGTPERGEGRGHDPGRLGAHAENPATARREDLEIEAAEFHPELLARCANGLLDGLACEFLVRTHQRRLPRRLWRPRSLWRMVLSAAAARLSAAVPSADLGERVAGSTGGGIVTGKRGVWPRAKPGVQPKSGNIPPQPITRYC
jgi:hypothetical protein